ncbi:MAG: DJ-1 family glyoxalase III [Sphaerochaetaceae bacterium]
MKNKNIKVLVPLANGSEEVEALGPVDVLRRAGFTVVMAAVGGSLEIVGAHEIVIKADILIEDAQTDYDAIVLPGGGLGAQNLASSWAVNEKLLMIANSGSVVAAICAAPPVVLGPAGLLNGRKAVCYPGSEVNYPDFSFGEERVCVDGNLITARGPGVALEFGLAIVEKLASKSVAERLEKQMLILK